VAVRTQQFEIGRIVVFFGSDMMKLKRDRPVHPGVQCAALTTVTALADQPFLHRFEMSHEFKNGDVVYREQQIGTA
jgi:hypothetical protein